MPTKPPDVNRRQDVRPLAPEPAPAAPPEIAEFDPDAVIDSAGSAPALDTTEAWEQSVMFGDENIPSFFDIPKPDPRFYYAWASSNALNMQIKLRMGWRLVSPEHVIELGLSPYQIDARGFATVMDAVLIYIPRKPVDAYFRKQAEAEFKDIRELPNVQKFLEMGRKSLGISVFAGDADEYADYRKWRMSRPVRVGYRKPPGEA